MASITLNINADEIVKHTARVEKIGKSALPSAVRQSLSRTAFDVKTKEMPKEAKKSFTERSPTFFKSQSKVDPAKGYDIKTMQAAVGFLPGSKDKESGGATKDLEQQEKGGSIPRRSFIPMKQARAGRSNSRRVTNKNRLAAIRNIINSKKSNATTSEGQFISSAIHAGKGGYVISNKLTKQGNKMLMRINSIKRKGNNNIVNSTPLYAVKKGRKVAVKRTRFMQTASNTSAKKIETYFIEEAEKQIKRLK